ncbi:hypothetical protein [uncultured Veillonella sp.]|nr:hypothetical protein [uncultured Veillonella sp.]
MLTVVLVIISLLVIIDIIAIRNEQNLTGFVLKVLKNHFPILPMQHALA